MNIKKEVLHLETLLHIERDRLSEGIVMLTWNDSAVHLTYPKRKNSLNCFSCITFRCSLLAMLKAEEKGAKTTYLN